MMKVDQPRILMFAPLSYPPAGSEAIATGKLLLAMLDAGWGIDVICQADFGQYYPATRGGAFEPIARSVHSIESYGKGGLLARVGTGSASRALGSLRSVCWTKKAASVGSDLLSRKRYDFILSRATPQYGHLPALRLSKSSGLPWIANWSDPIPPAKAPAPYGRGPRAAIPFYVRQYCSAVARRATWHTFPCERLRKYVASYLPQVSEKSSVIPHIALERFRSRVAVRNERFSMCHAGSLGLREPEIFLGGVRRFLDGAGPRHELGLKLVGSEPGGLRGAVERFGLGRVVSVEGVKTYEETQAILAATAVVIVLEPPFDEGIFFPSKFVDLVQTGRPILAVSPQEGTLADILSANGGGIPVDCRSAHAVAQALERLYSAWAVGNLDSDFGSYHLFGLFSEDQVLGRYSEIFGRVRA
jgi:hypothetical protein